MNVLLTGGTGYIGSHTAVALAKAGHQVVLFDNLSNSQIAVVERLQSVTGKSMPFVCGDVRDTKLLTQSLLSHKVDAVVHFAGDKAVCESVIDPVKYYSSNVVGSVCVLQAMTAARVKLLVFSSSAAVYGTPQYLPIDELHPTLAVSPYGHTKLHVEEILSDVARSDPVWKIVCLRYFNPVGAHDSGLIGENPNGIPGNLMPYIARVATGQLDQLQVFGGDYETLDGTGVRDYIHVMDLAEGHLAALHALQQNHSDCFSIYNLGTGKGFSVLEMIRSFEAASGRCIPYKIGPRRLGDTASYYADATKAAKNLGWKCTRTIDDMCESTWNFQSKLVNVNHQIA